MKYLANNYDEANDLLLSLSKCKYCNHFVSTDLFQSSCKRINRTVSHDDMCECFETKDKIIKYRINKCVRMCGDFSGLSDFFREWNYHEENGTEDEFLGLTQIRDKKK